MTLISHDVGRQTPWKTDNKESNGICLYLPFSLFLPGKKERPAKYDEELLKLDTNVCLYDVKTETKTNYIIKKIAKRDKSYGYYVFLIEL